MVDASNHNAFEEKLREKIGKRIEVLGGSEYFGFWSAGLLEVDSDGVYWVTKDNSEKVNISQYFGKIDKLKVEELKD